MDAEDICAHCGLVRREHQYSGAAYGQCGEFVEGEDHGAWMIVFEDDDMKPETFCGHGAKDAARKRFDHLALNWNIHLFERIASA